MKIIFKQHENFLLKRAIFVATRAILGCHMLSHRLVVSKNESAISKMGYN